MTRFCSSFLFILAMACSGAAPAPAGSENIPRLYLIGDSTVRNGRDNGASGLWGWGTPFANYFNSNCIRVINRALGGRSSRTFYTEGLWEKVRSELKPGDFVIMQFGHNDGGAFTGERGRASIKGNGEETREVIDEKTGRKEWVHTYGWYLRQYIAEAKAKGATPIVCSPIPRNDWMGAKVQRSAETYAKWAAEAAAAGGALFLDLNERIARQYESLGRETVTAKFFVNEHTHTSLEGARFNARCVVDALQDLKDCPLNRCLRLPNDPQ